MILLKTLPDKNPSTKNVLGKNTSKHYSSIIGFLGFVALTKSIHFAFSGVGILSIPYALASGGWLSLILLLAVAFISFYTGLLIQRCMDVDSNIRTYPDISERAFGNNGKMIVSILMSIELYLVATGFLILEGDNLQNLFPNIGFEILGLRIGGKQSFTIIVGLIVLPSVWFDNMSILSYISVSGILACVIIIGSILWVGAFDGVGFHGTQTILNWSGIPTALSLYTFCFSAHLVFPTLYTSMKDKRRFSNVSETRSLNPPIHNVFGFNIFGWEMKNISYSC